jgi:hypothetical protein
MRGDYPQRRGRNRGMSDQEVPEPDAAEQAQPVATAPPGFMEVSSDPEAPEADAYEQAIEEPVDEEESAR